MVTFASDYKVKIEYHYMLRTCICPILAIQCNFCLAVPREFDPLLHWWGGGGKERSWPRWNLFFSHFILIGIQSAALSLVLVSSKIYTDNSKYLRDSVTIFSNHIFFSNISPSATDSHFQIFLFSTSNSP